MTIQPGTRLGQYEILSSLGAGGMGEVWRVRDTTLDREVAIKVLPDIFANHPDRLARFEREAKLLASLNHPGIAVIHGLHDEQGIRFLAMELVPGEDLAKRLSQGPLEVTEALRVALQVAEALEAAHAQGVIHRDLKPANVVLTPDGKAKVLDFGLAKAFDVESSSSGPSASLSPTVTTSGTIGGTVMGTAAYMSPEQTRGKLLDKRTDVWSFGCVLYECLTGGSLFRGESVSDSIGAILHKDPDWTRLPATVPPTVRLLLHRCLTKDRENRLHDVADARLELQQAIYDPEGSSLDLGAAVLPGAAVPAARRGVAPVALAAFVVAGLALGAAVGWVLRGTPGEPAAVRKFDLGVDLGGGLPGEIPEAAISPDGTRVAYMHLGKLWVQMLDELDPRPLEGTEQGEGIFWSPDSEQLGYFKGGKLWKVSSLGGPSTAICDVGGQAVGGRGADWGDDDRIVFSLGSSGIFEVSALGGKPEELVALEEGEGDLHEPNVLPDGRGLIFVSHPDTKMPNVLTAARDGERTVLLDPEDAQLIWKPIYTSSGHILFQRTGDDITVGLWAVPFSVDELKLTGEPFLVVPDASAGSVSRDGTLVFVNRPPLGGRERMIWADRTGRKIEALGGSRRRAQDPTLSPDGRRLAFLARDEDNQQDLWVRDLERGIETRLTSDEGFKFSIQWTSAGDEIFFGHFSEAEGVTTRAVPADGSVPQRQVLQGAATALSPDGRYIVLVTGPEGPEDMPSPSAVETDLWMVAIDGSEEPVPIVDGPGRKISGGVSPDGGFLAYWSDQSGRDEIYLTRFPSGTGRWQVSDAGGTLPIWDPRGDHLYYVQDRTVMQVTVGTGDGPRLGRPEALFGMPDGLPDSPRSFAVTSDGERFVLSEPVLDPTQSEKRPGIKVVQGWLTEFER